MTISQNEFEFKELGKELCPVCGHKDRCKATPNREVILCFRPGDSLVNGYRRMKQIGDCATYVIDNPLPSLNSNGHHPPRSSHRTASPTKTISADLSAEMERYQTALTDNDAEQIGRELGLSRESLRAVGAGKNGKYICTPERDALGNVTAICTRYPDGKKVGKGHSPRGLITQSTTQEWPGPTVCVEGASDTCAMFDMQIKAVGRFNNSGGASILAELYKGQGLIILGENDKKSDGKWPGNDGAIKVATEISRSWGEAVYYAFPPDGCKDAREFLIQRKAAGINPIDAGKELFAYIKSTQVAVEPNTTPEWQPFPLDVFTPKLQRIIQNAAESIDVDPSMVALPLLVLFAAAVGNSRQLVIKTRHYAPAILWGCIVGESGDGKTPALGLATRQLQRLYTRAIAEHKKAVQQFWAKLAEMEKQPKEERGSKPAQPILARVMMDNTTIEALIPIHEENQRGLVVFSDELGGWIDGFNQYKKGGNDMSSWISMHSGTPIMVDRKGASGQPRQSYYVPRACVSVCGGIQPATMARIVKPEHFESGMVGRLLFTMPPDRLRQMSDTVISDQDEADLDSIVDLLYELQPHYGTNSELTPKYIGMSNPAKAIYREFSNEHYRQVHKMHGDLRAAFVKKEAYTARLALVLHLARWAAGESIDPDKVDEDSMNKAIRLVRWFTNEDRRVYEFLSEGFIAKADRELIEVIERCGGTATVREIMQSCRKYRGSADEVRSELDRLAKEGRGKWITQPTGGRDKESFALSR